MSAVFLKILNMSITASWLILFVTIPKIMILGIVIYLSLPQHFLQDSYLYRSRSAQYSC